MLDILWTSRKKEVKELVVEVGEEVGMETEVVETNEEVGSADG